MDENTDVARATTRKHKRSDKKVLPGTSTSTIERNQLSLNLACIYGKFIMNGSIMPSFVDAGVDEVALWTLERRLCCVLRREYRFFPQLQKPGKSA